MKWTSKTRSLAMAAAAATLLSGPVLAHNYNYLEGGYLNHDQPGDEDGFRMAGSFDVFTPVAIFAEYADVDYFSQLSVGALYHMNLQRGLDLNLGASFETVDVPGSDESGFGLRAGLRWMVPNSKFELNPEIRHIEIDDFDSTSLRLAALYPIANDWDLQAAVQAGDDDRFELGVRYNFGPRN